MIRVRFLLSAVLAAVGLALAPAASAQVQVVCTGLAGCGAAPGNVIMTNLLPAAVDIMIQLAAGGSVVFIVIAGVKFLTSYGDEGKVSAAKKGILYGLGGLGMAITSASLVSFVTSENYGQSNPANFLFGTQGLLQSVINITITLSNVAFAIVVILAGIRMVTSAGDTAEFKKGGQVIKWAIVGAVVINLSRAIVQAFINVHL